MSIKQYLLEEYNTKIQKIANHLFIADDYDLIEIFNHLQKENVERIIQAAQSVLDTHDQKHCSHCKGEGCEICKSFFNIYKGRNNI